ncbi:ABC transporter permease [Selenihalanaerobacter shriftii]|uniref:Putative spermidine/putrescine transport system permease protein n=1 Tax=Selenihalanaerobacter shriftii TaxID=142842 RepID=A0A1T4K593_9FIRM|nr:ABC transporter permease subunit [Selenihalanaerobacter shriftii]SJZ37610.1 putative spermidine/putrescine transport system permease protein [Selenihalanaerobacter shriftii]
MVSKTSTKIIRLTIVYALVLVLFLPLIALIIWSFSNNWPWPQLWPQTFTLEGWKFFINPINGAWQALKTSFLIGIGVTILALAISIPAGKALGIYDFPGKEFIKILVLAPIIIPPLAVTMGIHINFIRYGLSDTILGVILVHLIPTIPYSIRILTNVFEASGEKLEAQAQVLGASVWQRFIYITLPMIYPGIFSAGIMVFIISFSQYFLTFLIGGGQVVTFPMVLFPLVKSGDRMLAAVYSWVFIIAALAFTLIMERLFKNDEIRSDHFHL